MDKNIETDDMKLTSILTNLEEQIRELKTYCVYNCRNLTDRRFSKRRGLKRKPVLKKKCINT